MPLSPGLRRERMLASPQFRAGRFHNLGDVQPGLRGSPWPVMREMWRGRKLRVPSAPLPVERPHAHWQRPVQSGLRVTWLGHSTLLLEIDGVRVLTDPVFGERASPLSFAGPKRFHPVPATIDELPPLHCVLLSHNHHDHLCPESIRALARRQVPIVTSLGVGADLERAGADPEHIIELDWWQEHVLPGGALSLTATPAQHFSGRGLTDRNATLWSSWVLTSARRRLFFSGDTGLTEQFSQIAERLGPFELTMLEIGAWNEAWGEMHLGPANAVRAFELLGGGALLPVHWGTFDLALHRWDEPAEATFQLCAQRGLRLLTPRCGLPLEPAHQEAPQPWWRTIEAERAVLAAPATETAQG